MLGLAKIKQVEERKGMAHAISNRLANLMATRVALLTIVLVMMIPIFDVLTFPQNDYALQAWVQRLTDNLQDTDQDITREMNDMAAFFKDHAYGPFKACTGRETSKNNFQCSEYITNWTSTFEAPGRSASSLLVYTESFMVGFNMHNTILVEATVAICNICFICVIMVVAGMSLSEVVNSLAVRPLERMMTTVRQIATSVFKFSAEVVYSFEEDGGDLETSAEMKLLEKVVAKLAIIADLQTRDNAYQNLEDEVRKKMRDEDVGILNMMQGKHAVDDVKKQEEQKNQVEKQPTSQGLTFQAITTMIDIEDAGLTKEVFHSWGLNAMDLTRQQKQRLCLYVITEFSRSASGLLNSVKEEATLKHFVEACEKEYMENPFHNFTHAVDVAHGTYRLLRLTEAHTYLSDLEQYSLLISAVGHDIGHPGVNNSFLCEVAHALALQYNDKSPLENMHCSRLYGVIANEDTNVYASLSSVEYREIRKLTVETILHTDMIGHFGMVKDLQMVYQMNQEVFDQSSGPTDKDETEIFSEPATKLLAMETILHSADVSNPARKWEVTAAWAHRCLEEFFAQGDEEKRLKIPVQFLNDRDKLNRPNSQIGFIEFMIAPFIVAQIRLWPALDNLGENLAHNIGKWEERWRDETKPAQEDLDKVRSRVAKVQESMDVFPNRPHAPQYQRSMGLVKSGTATQSMPVGTLSHSSHLATRA
jgi:hypothetical protein